MMEDIEICGNICVKGNREEFFLKCFYCDFDIKIAKWYELLVHFRESHNFPILANSMNSNDEFVVIKDSEDKFEQKSEIHIENSEFLKNEEEDLENSISAYDTDFHNVFLKDEFLDLDDDGLKHIYLEEEYMDLDEGNDNNSEPEKLDSNDNESDDEDLMLNMNTDNLSSDEDRNADDGYEQRTVKFNPTFYKNNSRTKTFIESYKSNPCLWNLNDTNYRNKDMQSKAYNSIIQEMSVKENVILNERTLKTAIKRLHDLYEITKRKLRKGPQRMHLVLLTHYKSCKFLENTVDPFTKDMEALENEEMASKIKLNFSTKNELTINLINLYSGLPHLYDPDHINFTDAAMRKKAYETITAKLKTKEKDICCYDIIGAIQNLRRWYYKTKKYIDNESKSGCGGKSNTELFYVKKCNFLTSKTFKQQLPCELCQKNFNSDFVLQTHLYNEHGIGELPYKCVLCDRNFKRYNELVTHKQRVHIGKVHKCTTCDRTFAVVADLKMHNQTHTGAKPYICESCGKAFRKKTQLGEHTKRMHTKIRAFKCNLCPKSFLRNADLKDHVKAHLNIRDKICETCGKGFTNCHSLIRHRQIHSEVKKFVCKLCSARFSQFVGLNSHMKRTHNILRAVPKETDGTTN